MYSRTTDDYERMALANIRIIVEPGGFWLGNLRKHAGTFFDYFDHLLNYEHLRAAEFGITHYCTVSMNPKEANDEALAAEVLEALPQYLQNERVLAVGEIGLDQITEAEEKVFIAQLDLGLKAGLPVLIHSPHNDKKRGIERIIAILKELDYPTDRAVVDHNTEETIALTKNAGYWAGHTVYPLKKLSPERATSILQEYGTDKMLINSSADWGISDPLGVPKTAMIMKQRNFTEDEIRKVVWDNPRAFYETSGRLRIEA
jgi:predicted metal-dependent TIM-barrel fold hydrolase